MGIRCTEGDTAAENEPLAGDDDDDGVNGDDNEADFADAAVDGTMCGDAEVR